jgi:hypothetical protein
MLWPRTPTLRPVWAPHFGQLFSGLNLLAQSQIRTLPVWAICERMAEVQALLDDHIAGADLVAKAQAILTEPELLRAMFDVGYFPPETPLT